MYSYILDAFPYEIVFADKDHIIRYMNREAEYRYYIVRGYRELIGRSILDCHSEETGQRIAGAVERMKNHGDEELIGLNENNEKTYLTPVRNEDGELIGYFERFEKDTQK